MSNDCRDGALRDQLEGATGVNTHLPFHWGPHSVIQGLGCPAYVSHGLIEHPGQTPGAVRRHKGRAVAVKPGHVLVPSE